MSEFSKFKREFEIAIKKSIQASEKSIRAAATQVFTDIIKESPVGDPSLWDTEYPPKNYTGGSFRGNWRASLNKPETTAILNGAEKRNSAGAVRGALAGYQTKDDIFLANNLPYAQRLEDGWSVQADKGWVERRASTFNKVLQAQVRKNKK